MAAKNKITLEALDSGVRFTFINCDHYLYGSGTIDVPLNALSLVIDESNMVTFKKAASDDVFISAPIDYFNMSKEDLEDWYAENMVGGTGGGIDPETLAELVSSAEYVSSSSTIDFKNVDGEVISTINAEPFITDGMVDNVQISGTNLVITFNVDAGKQPISIPLTDIFNPSNYYDKTATDTLLNGKVAVSDYNTYTAATDTALSGKADVSAVTAISDSLSGKADVSAVTAVADSLSGKQDTLVYYSEDTENGEGGIGISVEDGGVTKSSEVSAASDMDGDSSVSMSASEYSDDYYKSAAFYGSQDGIEITYNSADNVEGTSINQMIYVNGYGFRIETNSDDGESVNTTEFSVTPDGVTINNDAVVTESVLSGKADTSAVTAVSDALSAKADVSAVTAAVDAVTPCVFDFGRAATLGITDADWNGVMDAYVNHKPIIGILGTLQYVCESLVLTTDADDHQVFTFTVSDRTSRYILSVTNLGNSTYQITQYDTIALPTTNDITNWNGKQDTLVAGSGITISGNVISADGGGGGMSEDDELLLATALVDLNDRKMDTADAKAEFAKYQKKGDYVTSGQLDTKLAAYETALDEQNVEEVASYALNDLNARLTTVETALGGLSLSAITQSQWATISGSANPSTIYIITNN